MRVVLKLSDIFQLEVNMSLQALINSFGNFSEKVKAAINSGDAEQLANLEQLMQNMREEFDEQTIELGAVGGGDFGVAITERVVDLGEGTVIDCGAGNHFLKTITGNTTFSLDRVPAAGRVCTFILRLTNPAAGTLTFWGPIKWNKGKAPTWSNGLDVVAFTTYDGGLTWEGYQLGENMSVPA